MNICITVSPNDWIDHVAVEMYSLFKSNPAPIKVYIISDELSQEQLNKFNRVCKICGEGYTYEYINALPLYNKLMLNNKNVENRFTRYTLYRLLIPYLIDEDRLLYIDADAAVVGNIENFYNKNFDGNLLIGVVDSGINNQYKQCYGLSPEDNYCNAGILLWNLKEMKKLNLVENWIKNINEIAFLNHDQDVLMISCKGRVGTIGLKYNTSLSTGLQITEKEICIMHWAGVKYIGKGWVKNLPFPQIWDKLQNNYDNEIVNLIPKVIYTCWFGHGEKPQIVKDCMNSWKQYMPDYKIIEINENNFDINCNQYAKKAYEQKRWAFLTDYVRLKVLYDNGGIYLDADVKILKPLDVFLKNRAFTGYEADCWLLSATIGSEKGHPWIKMLLDYYETAELNNIPNTQIVTQLSQSWIEGKTKDYTYLREGVIIYPTNYFSPYDHMALKPAITSDSYSCHLYLGSWLGRTKIYSKRYNIDLSEILDEAVNWQMSYAERSSIFYLLSKLTSHNVAIEVGNFQGGLTFVLDKWFKKVYSLDIDHSLIFNKSQCKNTHWIDGDSINTLPVLIDQLNTNGEDVNFILLDPSHEYDSVYSDVSNLLRYKPKSDLVLLIHDSFYTPSRQSICAIPWKSNPYVHYVNTDFCQGEFIHSSNCRDIFIGGLCLVIMSPQLREVPLVIEQPHDYAYCKVNQLAGNQI
jgi:Lipopolysaccharide biosynthesis proteins, LPS:glycosyltransferases